MLGHFAENLLEELQDIGLKRGDIPQDSVGEVEKETRGREGNTDMVRDLESHIVDQ